MRKGRALFLTGLLLLGQAAGLAHQLFVAHVTCPEHGDLIHPREGQAAQRAESAAWYPLPLAAAEEDGDHCATALHQGDRLTVAPPIAASAPATSSAQPCLHEPTAHTRRSALFRLAPKTSPPLAG